MTERDPGQTEPVRRERAALVRRRLAVGAACLALVGAGTAVVVTQAGGDGSDVDLTADDGTGQRYTAAGRVVQDATGRTRICAPEAVIPLIRAPRPPALCALGVDVRGIDVDALDHRREMGGAIEGNATVEGRLDGDLLVVDKQAPGVSPRRGQQLVDSPCPAPAGGWPTAPPSWNPDDDPVVAYRRAHLREIAEVGTVHPTATTYARYVLTYGDPQDVYDGLRPTLGDGVCVKRSAYTRAQVLAAQRDPVRHSAADGVFPGGVDQVLRADGQLAVQVEAVRETPALQALVARHPAGLIQVLYWLHPVAG